MTRLRCATLLLLLVAGLAVNMIVTVACIMWSQPDPRSVEIPPDATMRRVEALWIAHWPADEPVSDQYLTSRQRSFGLTIDVCESIDFFHDPQPEKHTLYWYRAGWPLASLQGGRWRQVTLVPDPTANGAMMITGGSRYDLKSFIFRPERLPLVGPGRARIVPYGPAWPGLLLNSLLYAFLAGIAAWLITTARRRRRRSHHQCPACGYTIGSSPTCSECGADVSGAAAGG